MRATNIRKNQVLRVEGALYRVLAMDHVTPGKGAAVVQTKLRNLLDGTQTEIRFRSSDDVEEVSLTHRQMQYLYSDAQGHHFMDTETYNQVALDDEVLGEALLYLVPDQTLVVQSFEERPIGIALPPVVDLRVIECTPAIKGATASAQRKPAKLETGVVVQVPPFIEEGDMIRVNTLDGSYSERVR